MMTAFAGQKHGSRIVNSHARRENAGQMHPIQGASRNSEDYNWGDMATTSPQRIIDEEIVMLARDAFPGKGSDW